MPESPKDADGQDVPATEALSRQLVILENAVEHGILTLQQVLDYFPGIVFLSDKKDMSLLRINRNGMEILEMTEEHLDDLRHASFDSFVHPDNVEFSLPRMKKLQHSKDPNAMAAEFFRLHFRNGYRWVFTVVKIFKPLDCLIGFSVPLEALSSQSAKVSRFIGANEFRMKHYGRFQSLTKRETELLRLIANGESNVSISDQLHISLNTVKSHRKNLNLKLDIKNVRDLMRYAVAFDLVDF